MVKRVECKIINSVSLGDNKRNADADKRFTALGQKGGVFACYSSLLSNSSCEQETFRQGLNILV